MNQFIIITNKNYDDLYYTEYTPIETSFSKNELQTLLESFFNKVNQSDTLLKYEERMRIPNTNILVEWRYIINNTYHINENIWIHEFNCPEILTIQEWFEKYKNEN